MKTVADLGSAIIATVDRDIEDIVFDPDYTISIESGGMIAGNVQAIRWDDKNRSLVLEIGEL